MYNQTCLTNACEAQSVGAGNQLFASLITTILAAQCSISPPEMWPRDFGEIALQQKSQAFDFIIVGAGAAGSVVANRLSENPNWNVLLIEAGANPPMESQIPGLYANMINTEVDWRFKTISSRACGLGNGVCFATRGKMLGGTTSINGMMYVRGNRKNYDSWAAAGNIGWNYENVLPYFKKSEANRYEPFLTGREARYHNGFGPMKVNFLSNITEPYQIIVDAVREKNIPIIQDINAEETMGFLNIQLMADNGRRSSTAKAFLSPIKDRRNLFVMKNALVEKVLINESNKAYGVKLWYKGRSWEAYAKKEVILSAGTFMSPQILMRSGVGPSYELHKQNIRVKKDLPVGKNLIDQPSTYLFFKVDGLMPPTTPTDSLDTIYNLAVHNSGPAVSLFIPASFTSTEPGAQYPNYETLYFMFPQNSPDFQTFVPVGGISEDALQDVKETNKNHGILAMIVILLQPESRGTVKLNGSSCCNRPIIDVNYFEQESDLEILATAVKEQISFASTKSFQSKNVQPIKVNLPECNGLNYESIDYWKCYVQQVTATVNHHVGTCKMGPSTDPTTVIDPELRVHGISGLRVIDGSSIPYIISGHTTAPIIMIGEKGSDLIKKQYLYLN